MRPPTLSLAMQIALFVSSSDAVQTGWLLKFLKGISDSIKVYIISDFFYFFCCLIVQVNDILTFIVLLPIEITKPMKYLPNQTYDQCLVDDRHCMRCSKSTGASYMVA